MEDVGCVLRNEPGEYRMTMRWRADGSFVVCGESAQPITLTVRVEDAWDRLPSDRRRYSYRAAVRLDAGSVRMLEDVAPDARIFIEFKRTFEIDFT